jgi:hypothetical protein
MMSPFAHWYQVKKGHTSPHRVCDGMAAHAAEQLRDPPVETIMDQATITRIPEAIFSYFNRNALRDEEQYGMPFDQVVEIGARLRV